jgi:hypothetical protein
MVGQISEPEFQIENKPFLRFGNLSSMPIEIQQETGCRKPSYCVDMHSRPGFSGSPVFVYRTMGNAVDLRWGGPRDVIVTPDQSFLYLLGIHWGQFPEKWKAKDSSGREQDIRGLSGLTCVIPATRIGDLLNAHPPHKI